MALVPVRSKEPVNGKHFVTEVSEEWLERWPDDFDRLEGEELVRHELAKAGLNPLEINDVVDTVLALQTNGELETEDEAPTDGDDLGATVTDDPADEPEPSEKPAAKHAVAVDPTASSD